MFVLKRTSRKLYLKRIDRKRNRTWTKQPKRAKQFDSFMAALDYGENIGIPEGVLPVEIQEN